MDTGLEVRLPAVDRPALTGPVRRLLRSETVEVDDWFGARIHGGANLDGTGVYRFAGSGRDGGGPVQWSVILKTLGVVHDQMGDFVGREALAYRDGLLEDLPGGVRAPRCLGIVEQPGTGGWIWLEDVQDAIGPSWPLAHYGVVARHLGRFNGAYLVGQLLPPQPWLSSGWLRRWVEQAADGIAALPWALDHPLVRRLCPPALADAYLQLWAGRERFFVALDALPRTFCHNDAFRRNMFAQRTADGQDETVLIDWSFTGICAVGEELAPLVRASVAFFEVAPADEAELDRIVFDGYLAGLREAGWRGDAQLARFGYVAATVLRYGVGVVGLLLGVVLDDGMRAWSEQAMGRPLEEMVELWSASVPYEFALINEAWALLDAHGTAL
ncbi:MAG TPA: phosphotransferase [Roseiflexaceae bacterium]|nr:phosphotransferase [Roseiflexaceae bacterium]